MLGDSPLWGAVLWTVGRLAASLVSTLLTAGSILLPTIMTAKGICMLCHVSPGSIVTPPVPVENPWFAVPCFWIWAQTTKFWLCNIHVWSYLVFTFHFVSFFQWIENIPSDLILWTKFAQNSTLGGDSNWDTHVPSGFLNVCNHIDSHHPNFFVLEWDRNKISSPLNFALFLWQLSVLVHIVLIFRSREMVPEDEDGGGMWMTAVWETFLGEETWLDEVI